MTSQGLAGAGQGSRGASQGYQGTQEGLTNGSSTGMQRAADGGMNPAPSSQSDTKRKPMGLFSFLAPLAGLAANIPGPIGMIGSGISAIAGMQQQQAQNKAAGAAQGAQGNALLGRSNIAESMLQQPDYSGVVKAEQSGINSLRSGVGGVANPNAVVGEMGGQNIGRAIEGANANQLTRQTGAADILGGNATQYNQIGTQATSAAQAGGNPFSLFSNALQGGGLGGLFGNHGGSQPMLNTDTSAGGIDVTAGMGKPDTTALNSTLNSTSPMSIGKGFGK